MNSETPREARKKLLLLEAQLHRLDLMQARQAWRAALRDGMPGAGVAAGISAGLTSRGGRLLLAALPLLLRSGALGRWARRGVLLAGGGMTALAVLKRWLGRSDSHSSDPADEKNPGQGRD